MNPGPEPKIIDYDAFIKKIVHSSAQKKMSPKSVLYYLTCANNTLNRRIELLRNRKKQVFYPKSELVRLFFEQYPQFSNYNEFFEEDSFDRIIEVYEMYHDFSCTAIMITEHGATPAGIRKVVSDIVSGNTDPYYFLKNKFIAPKYFDITAPQRLQKESAVDIMFECILSKKLFTEKITKEGVRYYSRI